MSDSAPVVSVVMPVYNSEQYLRAAVESILAQTFRDFELIAVDDGSTDGSASILADYHHQDGRILILTHSQNQGIVSALNRGLKIASGKYIARMDADDISSPERFERQVEFLESYPQVGILGTEAIFIDSHDREIARMSHPQKDLSIRWTSLLANVFFHPTVMIRRAVLTEYNLAYQPEFQSVEDYDLWLHLLEHTQAANLDRPLLRYRVHAGSISSQYEQVQKEKHTRISLATIQRLFPQIRLPLEEHAMMVAAFTGMLSASNNHHRPALARRYLELWQAFVLLHRGEPALKPLRHEVVALAAKIGSFPPFQPGWQETTRCLFSADPLWVFYFCFELAGMIALKFKGIRLSQLRQIRL
jgi:glycosyltransferase involved in cell wall biosynthesis